MWPNRLCIFKRSLWLPRRALRGQELGDDESRFERSVFLEAVEGQVQWLIPIIALLWEAKDGLRPGI